MAVAGILKLEQKGLNILPSSFIGIYLGQEATKLYAIELRGSWGYSHRFPRPEKEGEVIMVRLSAMVVASQGFQEFFRGRSTSVFYLGDIGFA